MKLEEEKDLEFIDLEDEPEDEEYDESFEDVLDEKTLRFVHRVLFPAVIALVAVLVVGAAIILLLGG